MPNQRQLRCRRPSPVACWEKSRAGSGHTGTHSPAGQFMNRFRARSAACCTSEPGRLWRLCHRRRPGRWRGNSATPATQPAGSVEVPVEGPLADTGGLGDLRHRGGLEAVLGEQPLRRLPQPGPGCLLLAASRSARILACAHHTSMPELARLPFSAKVAGMPEYLTGAGHHASAAATAFITAASQPARPRPSPQGNRHHPHRRRHPHRHRRHESRAPPPLRHRTRALPVTSTPTATALTRFAQSAGN